MWRLLSFLVVLLIVGARAEAGSQRSGSSDRASQAFHQTAHLESLPARILTGEAMSDRFGWSIASAGDVNGDGYGDLIVGAPGNDAAGEDFGRAYIYFGGPAMDQVADVTLTGEGLADQFGWCVASAGDVNNDGYGDVIVGVPTKDAVRTDVGRVYIYFGGARMDSIADVTLTGRVVGDYVGYSVACAGDVNGDGYSDVIVGAIGEDIAGFQMGAAFIYYGGAAMDTIADVILTGPQPAGGFGASVASAGDVNGDGYSDVVIGSPVGYIYFGGPDMDHEVDVTLAWQNPWAGFGIVAPAGDVNGDGYSDVIAGSPSAIYTVEPGLAYLYYGGAHMNGTANVTFAGESIDDHIGRSVAGAGDLDRDGHSDLIIGTPFHEAGSVQVGGAYIYFGGKDLNTTVYVTLEHAGTDDQFGWSVAAAGDIDGNGFGDVIVGAPAGGAGAVYVYLNVYHEPPRAYALHVNDDAGGEALLSFGFTQSASSGIDTALGELELPPPPPAGAFDARFVGQDIGIDLGEGSLIDYRQGDSSISGERVHEIAYQVGSGSTITLAWTLPRWIEGRLQDIISGTFVDTIMKGEGSYTVVNPGSISKLKMTINYGVNAVSVEDEKRIPAVFRLEQNYPNPFNPLTIIGYTIAGVGGRGSGGSKVKLSVYDLLGREVATLVNEVKQPGVYQVDFDGSGFASGVYVCRMSTGSYVQSRTMLLIK